MPKYEGEERRMHCGDHEEYHETLTRVATNTDWIIAALKRAAAITGAVLVVVIIPASLWLVNLDKRVSNLETRLTLHISPESKR